MSTSAAVAARCTTASRASVVPSSSETQSSATEVVDTTSAPATSRLATDDSATDPSDPGRTTKATRLPCEEPGEDRRARHADVGVLRLGPRGRRLQLAVEVGLVLAESGDLLVEGVSELALQRTRTEDDPHGEGQKIETMETRW